MFTYFEYYYCYVGPSIFSLALASGASEIPGPALGAGQVKITIEHGKTLSHKICHYVLYLRNILTSNLNLAPVRYSAGVIVVEA